MQTLIYIGDVPVSLGSTTISVVLRSPVFPDEKNSGSFLFNFPIPLTDAVKKEIGYAHRPSSNQKIFSHQVTVKYGPLIFSGTAKIKTINHVQAEISLPTNNGALISKLKNLSLPGIDTGGERKTFQFFSRARVLFPQGTIEHGLSQFTHIKNITLGGIERDLDNLFKSSGQYWQCPQAGEWSLILSTSMVMVLGQNHKLQIFKNAALLQEYSILVDENNRSYFAASGTETISVKHNLALNDQVTLKLSTLSSLHPTNTINPHWVEYTMDTGTGITFWLNYSLYQASVVGYPYSDYAVFPVYNHGFYANAPKSRFLIDEVGLEFLNEKFPIVNYFDQGEFPLFLMGVEGEDSYSVFNTMVAFPYITYLLNKVFESSDINLDYSENPFESPRLNQLCMVVMAAINEFDSSAKNSIRDVFDLTDVLPDISFADFLSDVCKTLGVVYEYSVFHNTIRFTLLQEIMDDKTSVGFSSNLVSNPELNAVHFDGYDLTFKAAEDDFVKKYIRDLNDVILLGNKSSLMQLPLMGNTTNDCWLVEDIDTYYYWTYNQESGHMHWDVFSLNFQIRRKEVFDVSKDNHLLFDYELPLAPAVMRTHPTNDPMFGSAGKEWLIPGVVRAGYFKGIPIPKPIFSLLFYRAWQKDSNNAFYPMGSNGTTDYHGNPATDNPLELSFTDHANSLWTQHLRDYILWRSKTEGIYFFEKHMTAAELANFDFFKWHNILGTDYLIKELRFNLSNNGISSVQLDAVSRHTQD